MAGSDPAHFHHQGRTLEHCTVSVLPTGSHTTAISSNVTNKRGPTLGDFVGQTRDCGSHQRGVPQAVQASGLPASFVGEHLPNPHQCGGRGCHRPRLRDPAYGPSQLREWTASPRSHHGGARRVGWIMGRFEKKPFKTNKNKKKSTLLFGGLADSP